MGPAAPHGSRSTGARAGLALLVLACLALAWSRRFIQDDAFISLRYARNLARGLGLVFNPGERVQGYTDFLWTMWLSVPFRLGLDPVGFAFASGLVLYAGALLLAIRLARLLLPEHAAAPFLVLAILGANHTFSSYATGGLETMLQTFWALAALVVVAGAPLTPARAAAASCLAGLGVLTRPDSPLLLAPALVVGVSGLRALPARRRLAVAVAGLLPAAGLVAAWAAWAAGFYGSLLPNTWYVKGPGSSVLRGLLYVGSFAVRTLLVLLVGHAFAAWMREVRDGAGVRRAAWLGLGCGAVLWLAYVIAVGGDFMEYRFLVPALPAIALLATAGLYRLRPAARAIALAVLVVAGFLSPWWPHFPGAPQETRALAGLAADWTRAGKALSGLAGARPPLVIGVTAAGAVPYSSDLETVDLLGLNDAWIARHGAPIRSRYALAGSRPGHARMATPEYLERRGVDLLLNHPWLTSTPRPAGLAFTRREIESWPFYSVSWQGRAFPRGARMLEIPVGGGAYLWALQLRSHPAVDAAVAAGRWRAFPLRDGTGA